MTQEDSHSWRFHKGQQQANILKRNNQKQKQKKDYFLPSSLKLHQTKPFTARLILNGSEL